ncbi:GNAT family N-acetyltransferase [Pseudonocardia sp.]|uniref:GNAT family N-acetyltransferase n=1 Tax=Pseudonocardia sp. TaxID=60912 RepID=UPI003D14F95A
MSPAGTAVADVPKRNRYEITVDGERAGFVTYRRAPGRIAFLHTEIDDAHQGAGLAGTLVRAALDAARADGLAVAPYCPYVAGWIAKHPDYADLVPERHRHLLERRTG